MEKRICVYTTTFFTMFNLFSAFCVSYIWQSRIIMAQNKQNAKTMTSSSFLTWTEEEAELHLHCTNEYKVLKIAENVSWESCEKNNSEILELPKAKYPTSEESKRMGKDYPCDPPEIKK